MVAHVAAHILAAVAATFGLGRVKHLAQFGELSSVDGVAHGILRRGKAPCDKLSLHPLRSVWC